MVLGFISILSFPAVLRGQTTCDNKSTCVPPEDLEVFIKVLEEKRCLLTKQPTFQLETITLITDKDGRVYGSGLSPKPYIVRMNWCEYQVEAKGLVQFQVAMKEEPHWGFRLRPKVYVGWLALEGAVRSKEWRDSLDGGAHLEFFHFYGFGLNVGAGFRAVSSSISVDLLKNVSFSLGYGLTYEAKSDLHTSLSFALW